MYPWKLYHIESVDLLYIRDNLFNTCSQHNGDQQNTDISFIRITGTDFEGQCENPLLA